MVILFRSCFLSLLLMAGIVWKVRNRYISYILNRVRTLGFQQLNFCHSYYWRRVSHQWTVFFSCFSNDGRKDKRWPAVHLLECQFSFMLIIRLVLHTVNGLHHIFCVISRRVLKISFSIYLILPTKAIMPPFFLWWNFQRFLFCKG